MIPCFCVCVCRFARVPSFDAKADMYSLGIMLSELITGSLIPTAKVYTMDQQAQMVAAATGYLRSQGFGALATALAACVSEAPTGRPSSAELVAVLGAGGR